MRSRAPQTLIKIVWEKLLSKAAKAANAAKKAANAAKLFRAFLGSCSKSCRLPPLSIGWSFAYLRQLLLLPKPLSNVSDRNLMKSNGNRLSLDTPRDHITPDRILKLGDYQRDRLSQILLPEVSKTHSLSFFHGIPFKMQHSAAL